jgi:hypothetical protein
MSLADRMNDMKARVVSHADLPGIGWPPGDVQGIIGQLAMAGDTISEQIADLADSDSGDDSL